MKQFLTVTAIAFFYTLMLTACKDGGNGPAHTEVKAATIDSPEFYSLRPELEKTYGYSHAVKVGNEITISGAVSMDSAGNLLGAGSMEQQMKNCYADLETILKHYGCTYDDVVVENILTTDMQEFERVAGFRNGLYKKHFPAGSWFGVKELALPGQLIEIEMEVLKRN
jgi:2-iminobutanoate/2-iminopropanoate deaminase